MLSESSHGMDLTLGTSPSAAHNILLNLPAGLVLLDTSGVVTFLNPRAEAILGWQVTEATGQPLDAVMPLTFGDSGLMDRMGNAETLSVVDIARRDGQVKTLSISRSSLTNTLGLSGQTILLLRDITEADAVQRLRSYFLANISHEFRTPLSAVKASVELLHDELGNLSQAETLSLVNSIYFSVTGLQTLIDNLLESVSIEAGRFQIRRRMTDLRALIVDATHIIQPLLDRRRQVLNVNLPAQLPRTELDAMRITQVLVNLLSNASKYAPMETPIFLSLEVNRDALKFSVADQGEGVPFEERSNLFRRFIRLSEKDKAQYGIGLGLALVKAIVEQHGGSVGLDDNPGGGSVFWFTIPRVPGRQTGKPIRTTREKHAGSGEAAI